MTHSNVGGATPPTARLWQNGQARHHDGQDGRQAILLEHSSSPQKIGHLLGMKWAGADNPADTYACTYAVVQFLL